MDRYGRDFGQSGQGGSSGRERYSRDYQGGYGGMRADAFGEGSYGGMRSDGGGGSNWRTFPGEEGWFGGGSHSRDARYGGEGYGGGPYRGENSYGGGYGGSSGFGFGFGGYDDYGGTRPDSFSDQGGERAFGAARMAQRREASHLSRMRAADLMTEHPQTVTPDATLAQAAKLMRDLDVGIIPVVDSDQNRRLRGVITDRDIAIRAVADGKDAKNTKVSDCMTNTVGTVNKNDLARDVLSLMQREQVRRVPVTDREGRLVGIIAQADVALDATNDRRGTLLFADTVERISEPTHTSRDFTGESE